MSKKLRRTLSALLLVAAIAVTQLPVSDVMAQAVASDFQIDGTKLLKYTGTTEQVVSVPDGVKSISADAFSGHNELVKVTISGEVEKIGNSAFANCNSLRTVVIGNSVKEIESGAFSSCPGLVSVTLGSGVTKLGNGVFAGCKNLKEVTLDADNTYLSYRKGVIYDDQQKILYQMLPGYEAVNFEVPDTVSEIKAYAFWGNSYLQQVALSNKLPEIPAYAFSNCLNLKQINIPYSVKSIALKAFEDCVNLEKVTIPQSVSNIHETAFDGCPKVKFDTVEGTYGAAYADNRENTAVAVAEQTEVAAATVIQPESGSQSADTDSQRDVSGQLVATPASPEAPSSEEAKTAETSQTPEISTELVVSETLLGKSYIVSGKALVFIDNQASKVYSGGNEGSTGTADSESSSAAGENSGQGAGGDIAGLLGSGDVKGSGFPKFTIVDDRIIADQAYYKDSSLTTYTIPEGITHIGDFSFARSGLQEIIIPQGVERIGYAAFYHCDNLREVTIPDSVTEIEASAFAHTSWLNNWKNNVGQKFLVVGDGILLDYAGTDSVVNIPDGVKKIAPGVFQDHTGITAVNLPAGLTVIGEEAFAGCRNLKTLNGGEDLQEIRDRAFQNCALSQVTIPAGVKEIGLQAFDLTAAGTDTVTFAGGNIPAIAYSKTATRLSSEAYRGLVFGDMTAAVINNSDISLTNTVLDKDVLGFRGIISQPDGQKITENLTDNPTAEDTGVTVRISSNSIIDDGIAAATLPGSNSRYLLKITDSDRAAEEIKAAYASIYGNREPSGLLAYDISLYEQPENVPITKLGKQYITVLIPRPAGIGTENLHVVCVDSNGQLEEVSFELVQTENQDCIQFTTSHFSAYGIYQYSDGLGATAVVNNGRAVFSSLSGVKDASPDTGDFLHPKWFFAGGLLFASIAMFFYRKKVLI